MLLLVLLVILVILIVRRRKIQKFISLSKQIKCEIRSYPLIGHAYLLTGGSINFMNTFQKFAREAIKNGGMTNLWIGSKYYMVAVDAVDIEVVLRSSLEKDNVVRFARNFIGNGLIFAPVSIWRPRRKVTAPTFSLKNLNRFVKIFARQSANLVQALKAVEGNGAQPVWNYMTTYTLDTVCETVLGVKMNSHENQEEPLLKAFEIVSSLIAERMLQPWLQPDSVYKLLSCHFRFEKNKKVLHDFVNKVITSTRQKLKENCKTDESGTNRVKCFLELLMEASGGDHGYSDVELLEEVLVMLIAGTDTSASGMSFTVSMMAHNPDVQDKVFQELQEVFGDSDRPVIAEDLPHLKYLDAVIRESMRLYPPVPIIVREIHADTKLPSGITVSKECAVIIHIWGVHRNPVYWGDEAEQFRPERFLEETGRHPVAFLAFSHGPRNCLGTQYSMMSMKTALATLFRNYRVLSPEDNMKKCSGVNYEPLKVKFDVMMKDVDGFRVKLVKRKNNIKCT
uniref:Cytochrome P450 341B14 n=1 Tax=Hyphantria cunea TaxID=39466 RepID=A0A0D6A1C6_HYPCU|nr:cytochrome P450 341B14 [Hyphantria cunea]